MNDKFEPKFPVIHESHIKGSDYMCLKICASKRSKISHNTTRIIIRIVLLIIMIIIIILTITIFLNLNNPLDPLELTDGI